MPSRTPASRLHPSLPAILAACALAFLAAAAPAAATTATATATAEGDWPQWRGPARDGRAASFAAPAAWPSAPIRRWKVPVGIGHSSPIVSDGKIYLHTREGNEEVLRAMAPETGATLWRVAWPVPYTMHPAATDHGEGPKSTPVAAEGKIVTLSIDGTLSCRDAANGALRWSHDAAGRFAKTSPLFGTATSPLVDRGRVLAHVGGHDSGALTAFDLATGKILWAWDGDGPGYASPVLATLGGVRQVVTQSQQNLIGVSEADGRLLWKVPFTTPYVQNIVTPVVFGETVLFSGLDNGILGLRPARKGDGWAVETAWKTSEAGIYMSSPVLVGGRLCGHSHLKKGQYFCLDPKTGALTWAGDGGRGEQAAVVAGGDLLFLLSENAVLSIHRVGATGPAPLAATYTVADSPTWAHPVPIGNDLLIKDRTSLARLGFAPGGAPGAAAGASGGTGR